MNHLRRFELRLLVAVSVAVAATPFSTAQAVQLTERVRVADTGEEGDFGVSNGASISRDGRFDAFASSEQLLAIDTNTYLDIYRDHLPSKVLSLTLES